MNIPSSNSKNYYSGFLMRLLGTVICAYATHASAECTIAEGLPDLNCDGVVNVVALGDSFVTGFGDRKLRGNGGYIVRTQNRLSHVTLKAHGVRGLRTGALLKRVRSAFNGSDYQELATDLLAADLVTIDIGRNDRWLFAPPKKAYRNLKRIRTLIQDSIALEQSSYAVVTLAVLMLPNRGSQGPWVAELNEHIIRSHSNATPADLRFDKVSKRLLSADNLHPNSRGYKALSKVYTRYISRRYPRHIP
jgi:lysophospholipase L1-like esterase